MEAPRPAPRRWAAVFSLAAGAAWVLLSLSPTVITTFIGLPLAAIALIGGWVGGRASRRAGDRAGGWMALGGMGLGCVGCAWQIVVLAVFGGLIVGGAASLLDLWQATPAP